MKLARHFDRRGNAGALSGNRQPDSASSEPEAPPVPDPGWQTSTRYADQPMSMGTRLFGIGGVSAIALLIAAGALFTWRDHSAVSATATLSVFDVAPPAAPVSELPPAEKRQKENPLPEPDMPPRIMPPEIQIRGDHPIVLPMPGPVPDPGPPVKDATAPESAPAPPAPQISTGKPTWEGLVLGALNKAKRYPRGAQSRRQQGVPYIRFVMNREGRLLSSTLERSSGVPSLDRDAVELPRRAQPLPRPPDDMQPGQTLIELVVPVEYFLRH